MNKLLENILIWSSEMECFFIENQISHIVEKSPCDIPKTSIRIDFESNDLLSRMIVWESGECYLESIEIESEKTILSEHAHLHNKSSFVDAIYKLLRICSS